LQPPYCLLAGETISVGQLDRLIELSQTTHHLATTAITTRAYEQVSLEFSRHLEAQGKLVGAAVGAAMDKLGLKELWRAYALAVAHWTLLGEGDHERGDEPQPPNDPVIREYDVRPVDAPAPEAAPCVPSIDDLARLDDDRLRALGYGVADGSIGGASMARTLRDPAPTAIARRRSGRPASFMGA
jgi:hypothetical protein